MTLKKLVFCSTCAILLLGATPKLEANITPQKEAKKEDSLKKSLTTHSNTTGTIVKIVLGGSLFVGCTFISERLMSTYKITALATGLFGLVGGVGIAGWGIRDIIIWEKKYKAQA